MKLFYTLALALLFGSYVCPDSKSQGIRCGTLPYPAPTSQKTSNIQPSGDAAPQSATVAIAANMTILIPVVVHVVWNTAADNITDAQVCSQIQVLNEDFARLNADRANTPGAFAGAAATPRIQFFLATRDPNGNVTNGITRTQTSRTLFTPASNDVKATAQGGRDGWNPNRYLNVWVCGNLRLTTDPASNQVFGYSSWPADLSASPNLDGVVVWRKTFGRGAAFGLETNLDLGRTATHEIGHWLDLGHI